MLLLKGCDKTQNVEATFRCVGKLGELVNQHAPLKEKQKDVAALGSLLWIKCVCFCFDLEHQEQPALQNHWRRASKSVRDCDNQLLARAVRFERTRSSPDSPLDRFVSSVSDHNYSLFGKTCNAVRCTRQVPSRLAATRRPAKYRSCSRTANLFHKRTKPGRASVEVCKERCATGSLLCSSGNDTQRLSPLSKTTGVQSGVAHQQPAYDQ